MWVVILRFTLTCLPTFDIKRWAPNMISFEFDSYLHRVACFVEFVSSNIGAISSVQYVHPNSAFPVIVVPPIYFNFKVTGQWWIVPKMKCYNN